MSDWFDTTMGELMKVQHGFAFKGEYFSDVGELVMLTPGNFHERGGFRARGNKDRFYVGKFPDRYLLCKNDLIVAMTEQGEGLLGSSALIPESNKYLHNQRIGLVRAKDSADKIFLYYLFNLDYVRQQIRNSSSGAKIRHTSPERIYRTKVRVPRKDAQRKIAAILSAYDELIENNRRGIALLEKLAEEIYREWFVRFRFPGHEKVRAVKRVPSGWSFERASTSFGIVKGKSYAGDEITDDPQHMPFISLKSFNRGGGYREDGLKFYSGRYKEEQVVRQHDVVMAVTDMTQDRAVVGRAARVPNFGERGAVISLDAVKLVPHNINSTFLYAYMRHSGFADFMKEFANGTNVLHLKPELITKQKILLPPRQLQDEFAERASSIYSQTDILAETNRKLSASRDLLLPRLISGKLSVERLNIQFPPGMKEEIEAAA